MTKKINSNKRTGDTLTADEWNELADAVNVIEGEIEDFYKIPEGGIPKEDLNEEIQNSLDKANTALQEHQDISGKVDKPLNTPTINNFMSFDENGNAFDSGYNADSFAPKANAIPLPQEEDEGKILGYEAPMEGVDPVVGWIEKPSNGVTPHIDQTTKHWMIGEEDTEIDAEGKNAYQVYVASVPQGEIPMTEPQWLASLKGEKGDNAVNPFKGWHNAVVTGEAGSRVITSETQNLPTNPSVGDYVYVKTWNITGTAPNQTETPIAKIYECITTGTWSDSGRTADTSNVQTFASSEEVNEVHIINDFKTGGSGNVASAETTKILADNLLDTETLMEAVNLTQYSQNGYWLNQNGSHPGNFVANNNFRASEKISVQEGQVFYVSLRIPQSASSLCAPVCQWDANDDFAGVPSDFMIQQPDAIDRRYVVPSGVTKIAFSTIGTFDNIIVKRYLGESYESKSFTKDEIVQHYPLKKIGKNIVNPQEVETNKAIKASDGTIATSSGLKLSGYIPINGNTKITIGYGVSKGATYASAVYDKDKNLLRVFQGNTWDYLAEAPQDYGSLYIANDYSGDDLNGYLRITFSSSAVEPYCASYGNYVTKYVYNPIGGYLSKPDSTNDLCQQVECATGARLSYGTEESEWMASSIVDNEDIHYVDFRMQGKADEKPIPYNIVMINHDDGGDTDLVGVRKIYNKYDSKISMCLILAPFASLFDARNDIHNGRQLIKEGHEVGLHAFLSASYWNFNCLFDVKPDGTSTFAPVLTDFTADVDNSGYNVFGISLSDITSTTVKTYYKISGQLADVTGFNKTFGTVTQTELEAVNRCYNFYSDRYLRHGIQDCDYEDLMEVGGAILPTVKHTRLGWLEYWYNNLIDDTLGYSSPAVSNIDAINAARLAGETEPSPIAASLSDMFAADYKVPTGASVADYYPDAEHLLNGKIVFFDDTINPNYSNPDYQKVGYFKSGLYKGCASTCNHEVIDRCIAVAKAFFAKYYGISGFNDIHNHGLNYFTLDYIYDGNLYRDRTHQVLTEANGRFYSSRRKAFVSFKSLTAEQGIRLVKENQYRTHEIYEGQVGNYYGIAKVNAPNCYGGYNISRFKSDVSNYLSMFGGQVKMYYDEFVEGVAGVQDWLKWCYSNSNSSVTVHDHNNPSETKSFVIQPTIYTTINNIFSSLGTGKIPILSYDTLSKNPAIISAVDILLRAFEKSGLKPVPFGIGTDKMLSTPRKTSGNLFPNPCFNQGIWKLFDYDESNSLPISARKPDGWTYTTSPSSILVSKETVGEISNVNVLSVNGASVWVTRMYGLPSGAYKLTYWVKGNNATVKVNIVKNSTRIDEYGDEAESYDATSSWVKRDVEVVIPDFKQNKIDETNPVSVICQGCEDNVCAIEFMITTTSGGSFDLAMPEMRIVSQS